MITVPFPTMGGQQVWRDVAFRNGWKVQQNILTKHHRLLDPRNIRRDWGSLAAMLSRLDERAGTNATGATEMPYIFLVHGIAAQPGVFRRLKPALESAGYSVTIIRYPSTFDSIEAHADGVAQAIRRMKGAGPACFVTHSMGGLVARVLLDRYGYQFGGVTIERMIQIAPPNQGSAIARRLAGRSAYRVVFGKSGQQLTPESVSALPVPAIPTGIIAGGRGKEIGFNPFLSGDNDGTVLVSETSLPGVTEFMRVPALHSNLPDNSTAINSVLQFLKTGKFQD